MRLALLQRQQQDACFHPGVPSEERPLVLANCLADDSRLVSYVPDDEKGEYRAVHHALSKGYRRPLCINLPKQSLAYGLRLKGLQHAYRKLPHSRREIAHGTLIK